MVSDATRYDSARLYAGALTKYGRLAPDELGAQNAQVRETGLQVIISDDGLNSWEPVVTGQELVPHRNAEYYNQTSSFFDPSSWRYAWYRHDSYTSRLDNGVIVRVRSGDGNVGDSRLWYQTITDPSVAAQWTTWSLLESGSNGAVAIVPSSSSSWNYLHSKLDTSDGRVRLYGNGTLITAQSNITDVIKVEPLLGQGHSGYRGHIGTVRSANGNADVFPVTARKIDWLYTPHLTATTADPVTTNFRWYDQSIIGQYINTDRMDWLYSLPAWSNPRDSRTGPAIIHTRWPDPDSSVAGLVPVGWTPIRGVGGSADRNRIAGMRLFKHYVDDFYYLFYSEYQPQYLTNRSVEIYSQHLPVFWQRSKNLKHWTVPVFTGVSGIFKPFIIDAEDGYIYLVGNGDVYRRPRVTTTYDVSNYVPSVSGRIPSNNTAATGHLVIANPDGVNDVIKDMANRRITIRPGFKDQAGKFRFFDIGKWWVTSVTEENSGQKSQLICKFGDIWSRLDTHLLDTHNFPGKLSWSDWSTGKTNQLYNYFFEADPNPSVVGNSLQAMGPVIYTGWKGHNGQVSVRYRALNLAADEYFEIRFRYVDPTHYWFARVYRRGAGDVQIGHTLHTGGEAIVYSDFFLGASDSLVYLNCDLTFFFGVIKFTVNGELFTVANTDHINSYTSVDDDNPANYSVQPGMVGFLAYNILSTSYDLDYQISRVEITSSDDALELDDLIRTACAMGDLHSVAIPQGNLPDVYALSWGPQGDSLTPATGLKKALDEQSFKLVWRNGAMVAGPFRSLEPYRTIQNQLFESSVSASDEASTNMVVVDGNTHSWVQMDSAGIQATGWPKIKYFDSPALLTRAAVREKAKQELEQSANPSGLSGSVPLWVDLGVMDVVTWIDNAGNNYPKVRITGAEFEIRQDDQPSQRLQIDGTVL